MRALRIEVVSRPVKIRRQKVDAVETILFPIGLRLYKQHLLRETIGRVRLLRIATPQTLFTERYWSEFGIGADSADNDCLFNALKPSCLNDLNPHQCVLVEQYAWVLLVVSNASHACRKMDHNINPFHSVNAVFPLS